MSLRQMIVEAREKLGQIRDAVLARERDCQEELSRVHEVHRERARNLVHYWAFRECRNTGLRERLEFLGLDPLIEIEWDVLSRIDSVLERLNEMSGAVGDRAETSVDRAPYAGREILRRRAERYFGSPAHGRDVRIMVTLPAEAADDSTRISALAAAGADCFRINCARDDRDAWHRLTDLIRHEATRGIRPMVFMDLAGSKLRVSSCAGGGRSVRLGIGDNLFISRSSVPSSGAVGTESEQSRQEVAISDPSALGAVLPGHRVWFDDGKIGGIVRERTEDALRVEITSVKKGGRKLRLERGVNLPDTSLHLPALTPKDLEDLPFAARHSDFIALSFIRTPSDVHEFRRALVAMTSEPAGIVIKIETREAWQHLPELMLAAMCLDRVAILLARGDLAVECGVLEMPRIQDEVVRFCAAGALPLFWATGVMERMSRTGEPSRAEMTDAVESSRAQCVMLNRGEHTMDALCLLSDLLTRSNDDK
jgi:pyruvate kinase